MLSTHDHGRRRPGRVAGLAAVICFVMAIAASCTTVIQGTATYGTGMKSDAPPSTLKITDSDGGKIDQLAANSLDDIMSFWKDQFGQDFGKTMKPLAGGIYSYTSDQSKQVPCVGNAKEAAGNAFYCPSGDLVAYDRDFLGSLAKQYGSFLVTLVFAHEFGHAIQARVGEPSNKTIVVETQADCFAGVFVKQATKGTPHFKITSKELDSVLAGYLLFSDAPGGTSAGSNSHGSGFDRISAFQDGFSGGAKTCTSQFNNQRVFTEIPYQSANDQAQKGNQPYGDTAPGANKEFNAFFKVLLQPSGKSWKDLSVQSTDNGSPACNSKKQSDQVFYCQKDMTVYYADKSVTKQAYDKYGDFAVYELLGIPFAEAALDNLGTKAQGAERLSQAICLTGAFAETPSDVRSPARAP
ncbi:MAG: neutral zinc metallopeptidase [Antricoccus sp.]